MKIDKAYRYIKRKIIDGTWEPDTAIHVNEVSEELNISRTPIHKALSKPQQEGFVTIVPQVGVYVKRPDRQEVLERLLVCVNLDSLMTEYAALNLTEEDLKALENTLIKMDSPDVTHDEYSKLNIEFHSTIYKASKLNYTFNLARELWDYLNYVGSPDLLFTEDRRKKSQIEHWMIYYSLKEKDSKMARKLMENHLRRVADFLEEKYRSVDSRDRVFS